MTKLKPFFGYGVLKEPMKHKGEYVFGSWETLGLDLKTIKGEKV